jgi:hypothetical protein
MGDVIRLFDRFSDRKQVELALTAADAPPPEDRLERCARLSAEVWARLPERDGQQHLRTTMTDLRVDAALALVRDEARLARENPAAPLSPYAKICLDLDAIAARIERMEAMAECLDCEDKPGAEVLAKVRAHGTKRRAKSLSRAPGDPKCPA